MKMLICVNVSDYKRFGRDNALSLSIFDLITELHIKDSDTLWRTAFTGYVALW